MQNGRGLTNRLLPRAPPKLLEGDGSDCSSSTRCQNDVKRVNSDSDGNADKNEPKEGEKDREDSCAT